MKSKMITLALVLAFVGVAQAQNTYVLLAEDFEGLQLGESPEESPGTLDVWTDTPPPGWFVDESGVPGIGNSATDGVTDWAGWAFADKDFWVATDGQRREEFSLGQGTVAVADGDEWDDSGTPGNIASDPYDTWLSTPAIDISATRTSTIQLQFDSSWRPEFDSDYHQTGNLTVSFDGGEPIELFLWESDGSSPNFKDDNSTDETIYVDIDNPDKAGTMVLTFGYFDAGNDWWWAIDNILITGVRSAERAFDPTPTSGTDEMTVKTILGWTPGAYVGGRSPRHKVILSSDLDAVLDGSAVVATQDDNSFDAAGLLEYSTTYYWRIDEANSTTGWDEGSVWKFTVEPFSIPVETVTATASSSQSAQMGPENTVNSSGLNELDQHSTTPTTMWLSGMGDATPSIQYEFDKAHKLHEMLVWNSNQLIESFIGLGAKDVVIEHSTDGVEWTILEGASLLAQATGSDTYTANTMVDFGGAVAKFVKITINAGYGVLPQFGLSEVRFMHIPTSAREPQPADGGTADGANVVLGWRSGREAVSSEVYLGTNAADLALLGTTTENNLTASALNYSTTYYWSVTEVNDAADPSAYAGSIWSFTTPDFGTVDNFDQYDDFCNRIFFAWEDGLGHNGGEEVPDCDEPASNGNGGGSIVGNAMAPFAEKTIVNVDSRQSLPLEYDNSFGQSETTLTLAGQDWTASGVQSLSLFFYGQPENSGQLYVKINGTKLVYDGDTADITLEQWQRWNIDLTSVAGLQNVTTLTIGVDGGSASGMLYIDDIRLNP